MRLHTTTVVPVLAFAALALVASSLPGLAANEAATPDKKVEMLFVQSAKSASLENGKLTLKGVSATTVFFSDRPSRVAGHMATTEMLPLWSEGKNSFLEDPPNATLSAFAPDGTVTNAVVELKKPALSGDDMSCEVRVLQGKVPPNADGVSLFIDVIGRPLTPVSVAGVARRSRRRAIVYH